METAPTETCLNVLKFQMKPTNGAKYERRGPRHAAKSM